MKITDDMIDAAQKAINEIEVHAGDRVNLIGNRKVYELLTGWVVRDIARAALEAALRHSESE